MSHAISRRPLLLLLALVAVAGLVVAAAPLGSAARDAAPVPGPEPLPASDEPSDESVSLDVPAGLSSLGWFGLPTTSDAILAAAPGITTVFTLQAGEWLADSAALPDPLRNPFPVTQGTALVISAAEPTTLDVETQRVSVTTPIIFESAPRTASPDQGLPVDGESTLVRTAAGAELSVTVNALEPGYAYTVWWVIFNDPSHCLDGCGEDEVARFMDTGDNPVQISVLNATGGVADAAGSATMGARIRVGDSGGHQVLFGDGLLDPANAEIHFIVRAHGAASDDPAVLQAQTSTVGATCSEETAGVPDVPGDFACFDPFAGIHLPALHAETVTPTVFESAPMTLSPDAGMTVDGSSTLTRMPHGAQAVLTVNELEPGHAYTVWWVVFNNPDACTDGCGEDEVMNAGAGEPDPVNVAVLNATGGVADDAGSATFTATILEGDPQGHQVLIGDALADSMAAEIHLVVRSHGPASDDPAVLEAQTTTVAGACDAFDCFDPFASVHLAP